MDHQDALLAYIGAVIPERDRYLEKQALRKTAGGDAAGRDGRDRERETENALYHLRRADKVLRSLQMGELPTEYYRAEFDLLAPLIEAELRENREISLDFRRSVQ